MSTPLSSVRLMRTNGGAVPARRRGRVPLAIGLAGVVVIVAGVSTSDKAPFSQPSADGRTVYTVGFDDRAPSLDHRSCERADLPVEYRCSLRTALAEARSLGRPVEIRLPAEWIRRQGDDPLSIEGDVRIVGSGVTETSIDALGTGPVFVVRRGSVLRLQKLMTLDGRRRPVDPPSVGRVTMEEVAVSETPLPAGIDPSQIGVYCLGGQSATQYFLSADIVDPSALSVLAGAPF